MSSEHLSGELLRGGREWWRLHYTRCSALVAIPVYLSRAVIHRIGDAAQLSLLILLHVFGAPGVSSKSILAEKVLNSGQFVFLIRYQLRRAPVTDSALPWWGV